MPADDPSGLDRPDGGPSEPGRAGPDGEARLRLRPHRLLAGQGEAIFERLPESVLQNLWNPASEAALLWNLIYPLAQPRLSLADLLRLTPLWGSPKLDVEPDSLTPYYWGFDFQGRALPGLDQANEQVGESPPAAEVDLFLLGDKNLVLVEAKHLSGLGRCGRYYAGRCPEIHLPETEPCLYWEPGPAAFNRVVDFGSRPMAESSAPPCSRHYQLGRLLLLGLRLAEQLERRLHLWLLVPQRRWTDVAADWVDFAERVTDREVWRRMRVIAWEHLDSLAPADQIPK